MAFIDRNLGLLGLTILMVVISFSQVSAAIQVEQHDEHIFNFTLNDYIHSKQQREIAFEFFNYYKNFTAASLNQEKVSTNDLICLAQLNQLSQGLKSNSLWAFRFPDAWGSIPSGILYANSYDLGNFDECISIHKKLTRTTLNGKYCLSSLPISKLLVPMSVKLQISLQVGICMPASCSANTIDLLMKAFLKNIFNVHIDNTTTLVSEKKCQTSEPEPLSDLAIATIIVLSIFLGLMVLSTLYDYLISKDGKMNPFIRAFSARANGRVLFSAVDQSKNPNQVPCLHGMRCLSLIWVIYGHGYMLAIMSPNLNSLHIYTWAPSPYAMFIIHAVFAVDTFFFLSGLLLVMLALRDMDKTHGKLNVLLMYVHRYVRLTPILGIAIMVYSSLSTHLVDGPIWSQVRFENYNTCQKYWWETILYIQNYTKKPICLAHSWYLAVDTQLYFISPLLLIPLWKWGKKAVAGVFIFMLLLAVCLFTMMMVNNYSIFMRKTGANPESNYKIYFSTHTRASPWLVGLMLGYYLHITKGKSLKLSKLFVWLGWICSLGLLFTCIYALYPKSKWDAPKLTQVEDAFYTTLSRIAWPLGLSWVVFACVKGYGGLANSLLSSPLWQPLSRLSYCVYIWHLLIANTNAGRVRSNTYFSDYEVMINFWPTFGMTCILSVLMYLVIEAPIAGVEMLLLPNRRPVPKKQVSSPERKELNPSADEPTKNKEEQPTTSTESKDGGNFQTEIDTLTTSTESKDGGNVEPKNDILTISTEFKDGGNIEHKNDILTTSTESKDGGDFEPKIDTLIPPTESKDGSSVESKIYTIT